MKQNRVVDVVCPDQVLQRSRTLLWSCFHLIDFDTGEIDGLCGIVACCKVPVYGVEGWRQSDHGRRHLDGFKSNITCT